jgi:hypothetical protein
MILTRFVFNHVKYILHRNWSPCKSNSKKVGFFWKVIDSSGRRRATLAVGDTSRTRCHISPRRPIAARLMPSWRENSRRVWPSTIRPGKCRRTPVCLKTCSGNAHHASNPGPARVSTPSIPATVRSRLPITSPAGMGGGRLAGCVPSPTLPPGYPWLRGVCGRHRARRAPLCPHPVTSLLLIASPLRGTLYAPGRS